MKSVTRTGFTLVLWAYFIQFCFQSISFANASIHGISVHSCFRSPAETSSQSVSQNTLPPTLPLHAQLQDKALKTTLLSFYDIYSQYKNIFAPYYYNKSFHSKDKQSLMLYRQLCEGPSIKTLCKPHKRALISLFDGYLENIPKKIGSKKFFSIARISAGKENDAQINLLNQSIKNIRDAYQSAMTEINHELFVQLFTPGGLREEIQTPEEFNRRVQSVFLNIQVQKKVDEYKNLYLSYATGSDGVIFFSRFLRDRIELNTAEVQVSDLILAIQELKSELTRQLESHLTPGLSEPPRENHLFSLDCDSLAAQWMSSSELFFGKADFQNLQLLQLLKPSLSDHVTQEKSEKMPLISEKTWITTTRLTLQNRFQHAVWSLRDARQKDIADIYEKWIDQNILDPSLVEEIRSLGGGFTTTKIVRYSSSVRGVYKPKVSPPPGRRLFEKIQYIPDYVASHYKREIAAYKLDRLIQLNHVPITKEVQLSGQPGSLQYYIEKTTSALLLNGMNSEKLVEPSRWDRPIGRVQLSNDILFFDWLIDNRDRHLNNYLYEASGRPILIDNSLSFYAPTFVKFWPLKLVRIIPNENIYENIKSLQQNPEMLDRELKGLLSPLKLRVLKNKIQFFVEAVEKEIQQRGKDAVFQKR